MWVWSPLVDFCFCFTEAVFSWILRMSNRFLWVSSGSYANCCWGMVFLWLFRIFPSLCVVTCFEWPMWLGYCYCSCFYWRERVLNPASAGCSWCPLSSWLLLESSSVFDRQSFQTLLPGIALLESDLCSPHWMEWTEIYNPQFGLHTGSLASHPRLCFAVALSNQCSVANPDYFILVFCCCFWPRITQEGGNQKVGGEGSTCRGAIKQLKWKKAWDVHCSVITRWPHLGPWAKERRKKKSVFLSFNIRNPRATECVSISHSSIISLLISWTQPLVLKIDNPVHSFTRSLYILLCPC